MENYNFSYYHFNTDVRINIKIFKNYFQYKIYLKGKENNYEYIDFNSTNKELLKNKIFEEVLKFVELNKIKLEGWDPYWKTFVGNGIEEVTFPK